MKDLKDIIIEKLRINKDTKVISTNKYIEISIQDKNVDFDSFKVSVPFNVILSKNIKTATGKNINNIQINNIEYRCERSYLPHLHFWDFNNMNGYTLFTLGYDNIRQFFLENKKVPTLVFYNNVYIQLNSKTCDIINK